MEAEIVTQKRDNSESTTYNHVKIIKKIPGSNTLFLVREDETTLNDKTKDKADFLQIYKVQFLASCIIENFEKEMLVAFYADSEYDSLAVHILSPLPSAHYQPKVLRLMDYKAYCDTCDLTEETKLSFSDYYFKLKEDSLGINSLMRWKNVIYNADKQPGFLEKYDEDVKKVLNN